MLDTACLLGCSETHVIGFGPGLQLGSDAYAAFKVLEKAGRVQGFDIKIASAFRSFERQRYIWDAKARGLRATLDDYGCELDLKVLSPKERVLAILRWSALPGASRHHWGTDFDIYDAAALKKGEELQLTVDETESDGPFYPMYQWLDEYLADNEYFFRPYVRDLGGVAREPWHLSYKPLAEQFFDQLTPNLLHDFLLKQEIELKDVVLNSFDEIYDRFIANINSHG